MSRLQLVLAVSASAIVLVVAVIYYVYDPESHCVESGHRFSYGRCVSKTEADKASLALIRQFSESLYRVPAALEDIESTILSLENILVWEQDNASWINNLGVLYALSGRIEDAAILFQSALELKPNEAVKRVAIRWVLLPLDSERISTWDGTPASGEYQGVVPLHLVWPPGSTSGMLDVGFTDLIAHDGATDEWTLFNAIEPIRTVLPPHPSDQVALIRKVSPETSRQLQDYVQTNASNISSSKVSVRKRR